MKKYIYSFVFTILISSLLLNVQGNTISQHTISGINATLGDTIFYTENITICRSELPYYYSDNLFTSAGTYKIYLKTNEEKDSVITLHLNILEIPQRPGKINGDTLVNDINSYIYKIDSVEDATEYNWLISNLSWSTNKSRKDTTKLFIPKGGLGVLSVTAINRCGVSAASQLTIQSTLGINDYTQNKNIHLYPNPASNLLHIEFESKGTNNIQLYDIYGKEIKNFLSSEGNLQLDISTLSNGFYYLKITDNENHLISTCKFNKYQ
jgi:hypothetical protein